MIMGFHGRKMKLFITVFWACIWCLALAETVPAAPPGPENNRDMPAAAGRYVTIDFDEVDIAVFIKYISELTGRNFVVDKAVRGNVTIISPTKISADEAYSVFESVLEVEGFTTVPAGSITKIVPAVEARSKSVETGLAIKSDQAADKVVTQLIPLKYASPEELKKVFAPLVSKTSVVISYTPTGMLIVTDVMSNIARLQQIIKEIDVPAVGEEISVILLQHASAVEVAKTLTVLFQQSGRAPKTRVTTPAGKAATPVAAGEMSDIKIIPDERINGLIILASEDDTARIRQLLDLLDREVPKGEGDIKVYYLQNGDAEEMAGVLTALPTKETGVEQKGTAPVISKDVQIVADKATNALVITAKKSDYLAIEDVIKQLDIPRRMVYLEALIMEVNVNKDFSLGVEWRGGFDIRGNYVAFGGSRPGQDSSLNGLTATPPSLPRGLSLGVLGETITVDGIEFPSISALLQAYKNDADVHIVSTPQILTTDNQEAEIKVAENVPYITSQNTNVQQTDYTNYEYRDVGTTLKITPQINQEGSVRLQIFTEIIKLKDPDAVTATPTTLKRVADTTVIVQDRNTVVIGGIIGDDTQENLYKVPLLGDIPILGWLFKSKTTNRERTNLYIFLTPRIVRNPTEAKGIYLEKKEDSEWHHEKGFSKPFERKPEATDSAELTTLGFQQLQAGEFDKAKGSFERVLLVNQEDPEALLHLGEIYEAQGNPPLAVIMYEKVIALKPTAQPMNTIDPQLRGRDLADVAQENLKRLQEKDN